MRATQRRREILAALTAALIAAFGWLACSSPYAAEVESSEAGPSIGDGESDGAIEAQSEADGGGGANDDADATVPANVCLAAHTFCDDFDHDPLGLRWSALLKSGATLALDDAGALSA